MNHTQIYLVNRCVTVVALLGLTLLPISSANAQSPGCAADITGPRDVPDGVVDPFDLAAMLGAWCSAVNDPNPPSPPCENCSPANLALADITGPADAPDGCVDAFDLAGLLGAWGLCPPALNDDCDSPLQIGTGVHEFDTTLATTDLSDPAWTCGVDVGKDIWFCFQADTTGVAVIKLCGSSFDTVLEVYENCQNPLFLIACNDDVCALQSRLTVLVTQGNLYKIRIGGWLGDSGPGVLSVGTITCTPPYCPQNSGYGGPYASYCAVALFGEQRSASALAALLTVVALMGFQLAMCKRR